MPNLKDSLYLLHHPRKGEDLTSISNFKHIAQQRLIIEELAAHQLKPPANQGTKKKPRNQAFFLFMIIYLVN
jgi:ATP-dependent DNA helicase RecG